MTAPRTTSPELTHGCVRCGAPVAIDVGLCETCNPLGLRDVSATQVHGIAFIGVVLAIIALALIGRVAISGVGPFTSQVAGVVTDGDALAVTLTITNQGKSAGQTTCRLTDPLDRSGGGAGFVLSPQIEPGKTETFTKRVTGLGSKVRDLAVECTAP
ncbi:MAG: hypothetical protein Q7S35_03465 [Candidatus Limnocylindrales bacterium]|nr:hypothetical protein [Candidatus Limnocylindrales bacterium]